LIPALLLGTAPALAQHAAPAPEPKEAEIPFATHGGIYTFETDSDGSGVYLQDRFRHWYYARFFTRCTDLPYAFRIAYRTFPGSDTLDRGSTIIADRQECRIASLVKSDGPPPKPAKAHKKR
jgi:hypothetical protein